MKKDITGAPYYDTTAKEVAANYFKLLAVPGRVAQAREITVLQGLLQQAIKSIGDSIMSNGDIIEGCQIIVAPDKKSVDITPGRIYMEGIVTNTEGVKGLPISGSGVEIIGVELFEDIITDTNDSSLRDPAQGYDNFGQAGCDRLKRDLVFKVNGPATTPLVTLVDGDITVETFAPSYDVLTQTLARRTYDESGSYIVNGLKVRTEADGASNYNVVVEAGKAYVLGYELSIPTARRIPNPKANSTKFIERDEFTSYVTGTSVYPISSSPYVQSIVRVRGYVATEDTKTFSSNTESFELSQSNPQNSSIKVGDGNTYTKDVDYAIEPNGSRTIIRWLGTDNHPAAGNSYTVSYNYKKDFEQNVDYKLEISTTTGNSNLVFLEGGTTPINGGELDIEYNLYEARKDLVYIDQYGNLKVELGVPDEYGYEVIPQAPVNTLPIAQIFNPPNGSPDAPLTSLRIVVSNIGLTRFTMNDIQNILNRVKKTEYNQAVLSLNDDAKSRSTINSKKGILTDPLVDFSRIDLYYNLDSEGKLKDPSKSAYNMAIDLDLGVAYNPLNISSYDIVGSSPTTNKYSRLITTAVTGENVVLSQSNATRGFQVNPYSVFPQLPEVEVTPAVDSWVDSNYIEIPLSIDNPVIVETKPEFVYDTVRRSWGGSYNYSTSEVTGTRNSDEILSTSSETLTSDSIISEEAITYMRQITLTVEGRNYPPNLNNIKCLFDGVPVDLTPVEGTSAGTLSGTVKADNDGYLKATFMIPKGIRTGIREITLWSDDQVDSGYSSTGYTLYQSTGITRNIQRTLTTVNTVLLQRTVTTEVTITDWIDPVGQTFVLDRLAIIKGINVYFKSKPSSNEPVTVEIRDVVNGSIGTTIYAQASLPASRVLTDETSAKIFTRFNFRDPVVLDKDIQYAFVLRSKSDKYVVWVSELGGTDVESGEVILKNSYLTGVMMSSSNNSIWTAHQTMDVKFDLIEDVYSNSGSITFDPIPVDNITRLDLAAESVVLNGTTLKWYYRLNEGTTEYPITPGTLRDLGEVATKVVLRADFSRTSSENVTPILAYDTLLLIGSSYKSEGYYTGVNVTGVDPYTNVTVILDSVIPTGTGLKVYCSSDNGDTLTQCNLDSTRPLNSGWSENIYKATVPSSTACKVFIETSSSKPTITPKFSALRILMD